MPKMSSFFNIKTATKIFPGFGKLSSCTLTRLTKWLQGASQATKRCQRQNEQTRAPSNPTSNFKFSLDVQGGSHRHCGPSSYRDQSCRRSRPGSYSVLTVSSDGFRELPEWVGLWGPRVSLVSLRHGTRAGPRGPLRSGQPRERRGDRVTRHSVSGEEAARRSPQSCPGRSAMVQDFQGAVESFRGSGELAARPQGLGPPRSLRHGRLTQGGGSHWGTSPPGPPEPGASYGTPAGSHPSETRGLLASRQGP